MNLSKKHHYIPQFYLKGFTNSEGKFAIFDLERNVLKSGLYTTKSHFYEENRNTFCINGDKTDFVEVFYQSIEDKLKNVFFELQKAGGSIELTPKKIFEIQLFIYSIYWRIPKTDGQFDGLMQNKTPAELGFNIIDKKTGESAPIDIYNELKGDKNFTESLRAAYPLHKFINCENSLDLQNWRLYFSKNDGKNICSDFPIILRDPNNSDILTNDLLFPLTKKHLLVRTRNENIVKEIPPEFTLKLDIFLCLQSHKFVCCHDRDYLEMLSKIKDSYKNKIEILRGELFDHFVK